MDTPLAHVGLQRQVPLTTIQKILAEHEGFLRQFLVDDKVRLGEAGRGFGGMMTQADGKA